LGSIRGIEGFVLVGLVCKFDRDDKGRHTRQLGGGPDREDLDWEEEQGWWIFDNALIENPTFDSQTKETLTLPSSNFGTKPALTEEFLKKGLWLV